jgi:hypothetical protein
VTRRTMRSGGSARLHPETMAGWPSHQISVSRDRVYGLGGLVMFRPAAETRKTLGGGLR